MAEIQKTLESIKEMTFSGIEQEDIENYLDEMKDISDESLKYAKSRIIDFVVSYQLAVQEKSNAFNQIILGGTIFLLGLGITLFTLILGNSQYILAWGAILGGAWILKEGYKKYKRPISELVPRAKRIKRR